MEHGREGETNCWFSIFRGGVVPSDRIPKAMKDIKHTLIYLQL